MTDAETPMTTHVYWLSWSGPHQAPALKIPDTLDYWLKGWNKVTTTYAARIEHDGDIESAWVELARYFPGANLCVRHAQDQKDLAWWPHPKRYPRTVRVQENTETP